jgi:hypothetical protein
MVRHGCRLEGCWAALCLVLALPVAARAKPPQVPAAPRALGESCLQGPVEEPAPEKHRDLVPQPEADGLLLMPVEEGRRLTFELRLDKDGKRFLRMELRWKEDPGALPALRSPQDKSVPLPPLAPGW